MKLERLTQDFNKEEITKARKELENISLVSHFGGEIILLGATISGMLLPAIKKDSLNFEILGFGFLTYALLQIPAFFTKGISLNSEQNYELARKFEKDSKKGRGLFKWVDGKLSKMHDYFVKNNERYLFRYANLRGLGRR